MEKVTYYTKSNFGLLNTIQLILRLTKNRSMDSKPVKLNYGHERFNN